MPTKREKPVCSSCGSDDVKADAYAVWSNEAQAWEVDQAFDKGGYCNACDGECSIDWVEL